MSDKFRNFLLTPKKKIEEVLNTFNQVPMLSGQRPEYEDNRGISKISEYSKGKKFSSPYIQTPELGQPRKRELDPVTKKVLEYGLAIPNAAVYGLQSAGNLMTESKKAFQEGDILGGSLGTGASLLRAGFSAATPVVPMLSAFTLGAKGAGEIVGDKTIETVTQPATTLFKPKTLAQRSASEILDLLFQGGIAKLGSLGYNKIKSGKTLLDEKLSETPKISEGEIKNATQEGKIEESSPLQYQRTDTQRIPTETSNRNRIVKSGQEEKIDNNVEAIKNLKERGKTDEEISQVLNIPKEEVKTVTPETKVEEQSKIGTSDLEATPNFQKQSLGDDSNLVNELSADLKRSGDIRRKAILDGKRSKSTVNLKKYSEKYNIPEKDLELIAGNAVLSSVDSKFETIKSAVENGIKQFREKQSIPNVETPEVKPVTPETKVEKQPYEMSRKEYVEQQLPKMKEEIASGKENYAKYDEIVNKIEEEAVPFQQYIKKDGSLKSNTPKEIAIKIEDLQKRYKSATQLRNHYAGAEGQSLYANKPSLEAIHKDKVKQAIEDGKKVPDEVLKNYPDLAKVEKPGIEKSDELSFQGTSKIPTSLEPRNETIRASNIISQAEKDFGVPIRVGHIRGKTRVGIFKIKPEVVRLHEANNLGVMSHEIAHFIDKKFEIKKRGFGDELKKLDYDQTKQRPHEGFAEFIRYYLTSEDASNAAPKFYKYFTDEFLPKNPELAQKIENVKNSITKWREQGAVARVLSQIDFNGENKKSGIKEKFQETKLNIQAKFTNRLEPLNYVVNEIIKEAKIEKLRPSENPYEIAMSVQKTASAKAREFIMDGAFDFQLNKVGKSLKEIVEPISKDYKNALVYSYAKHSETLIKRGINPGISLEDAQYILKNLKKPEYEKFSKEFTEWSGYLLDYLVDAGGLSKEAATRMREVNPFYIPLKRSFEGKLSSPQGSGFTNLPTPIKRIKGSGREIINPLESMIAQTEQIISIADKTRVARALVNLGGKYEGMGKWIEKVPQPIEAKMTELNNLKKQIELLGGDLSQADLDAMVTLFSQGKGYFGKDNIVSIINNGKREYYELHPYLFDAMKGLDKTTLPLFIDYTFGKATRMIRLGATGIRAGFALITNPIRDAQTFFVQSEHTGIRPDKIAKSLLEEFRGTSEYAREFRRAGGEMSQPLGLDRNMLQNTIQEILANDTKSKSLNIVKHPIEALRRVMSFPEAGTRLTEFNTVMDKYKPLIEKAKRDGDLVELKKLQEDATIEASNAANEVTVNFKRAGTYSSILNQIIPFFNPAIQGVSRMGRTIYNHPIKSGLKATAVLTAPTLALWYLNKDEEWYKNLPSWQKYGFWNFKIGNEIIRLPKPFEWGYVFAGIPEGIAESVYRNNPDAVKNATQKMMENLTPDIVPGLMKPAMEAYFNWDMFRERPIVSQSQEGLLPEQQFTPYTSGIAKEIGKILNISPSKIDHLLSGYTGGLASDIIKGLPSEIKEPSDIPVLGRLFTRDSAIGFGGENVQKFYNELKRAESIYRTKNNIEKEGGKFNPSDEEKKYLNSRKMLIQVSNNLKELREKQKEISKLDYDTGIKRKLNQAIEESASKITEDVLENFSEGKIKTYKKIRRIK